MNKYEVLYIIDAKLDDAAKDALIERFKDVVVKDGGAVDSLDKWGVKKFAYTIDNNKTEGFYVLMTFSSLPTLPAELERQMRITDGIVRYLVINKD